VLSEAFNSEMENKSSGEGFGEEYGVGDEGKAVRPAIKVGVYTESVRLFRIGNEYTEHKVRRLVLGSNGHCFACIDQPEDGYEELTNMDLAGAWSDTGLKQAGDAVVKMHDNCGTHFMIPVASRPEPIQPDDELRLARICTSCQSRSA
jgi:hypothetical protein